MPTKNCRPHYLSGVSSTSGGHQYVLVGRGYEDAMSWSDSQRGEHWTTKLPPVPTHPQEAAPSPSTPWDHQPSSTAISSP